MRWIDPDGRLGVGGRWEGFSMPIAECDAARWTRPAELSGCPLVRFRD
jgi:hypothetical protein